MMRKIAAAAIVAALVAVVNADAHTLHKKREPLTPWVLSKVQPKVNLEEKVQMNIALKQKNVDLLEKILNEVSDPRQVKYGEHMDNAAIKRLVSPGDKAISEVLAWLNRHGITNVDVSVHGDAMKFHATRGQVSSLLDVQWATYYNEETDRHMVRALGDTSIPDHLAASIEMVQGHRGWPLPVKTHKKKATKKADFGTQITPSVIYSAYNASSNIPAVPAGGNVQSFAQFQGQYVVASDLTTFCSTYLPDNKGSCTIGKYIGGQDGQPAGVESSLDSEYIIATSYGAETWVYTYSGFDFCSDLLTWSQDVFSGDANGTHPNVISMSYGSQGLSSLGAYCEGKGANRLSVDTMKMGTAGISVLIASGDEGSGFFSRQGFNWGYLSPSFPAEMPYVTSVGSTNFVNGNSGTQRAASFSGGGFSWNWLARSYQADAVSAFFASGQPTFNKTAIHFNASGRATPDVSFLGEDFTIVTGGQTGEVDGTSCSTPSMSGFVTLLNNIRLKNGKTLGFLNPLFYQNPNGFTDVTEGSNGGLFGAGWNAVKGWDPVTGLGTPNFGNLAAIVEGINARENARKKM